MSKEKKEPVKLTVPMLQKLVDEGKTKDQIGKQFNLNAAQTTKLFKEAKLKGLKIKITRVVKPAFILTDENEVILEENTTEQIVESVVVKEEEIKPTKVKKAKETKEEVKIEEESNDPDLLQITNTSEEATDSEEAESNDNDW